MRLTIPDDQPLTITYEAAINAAPGQPISISNVAHWEGYTASEEGKVESPNFSYSAGGNAGADRTAQFILKKKDQADAKPLQGAKFRLEEVTLENGIFTPVQGKNEELTTDASGQTEFGKNDSWMEFNTIYCLTEIEAPDGFVADTTPYYFAIAKKIKTETDQEEAYPEKLETWRDQGVFIWYNGAKYEYTAFNHKGEAFAEKRFQDYEGNEIAVGKEPDGSYRFGLYEAKPDRQAADKPLQIVTITFQNGQKSYLRDGVAVEEPKFINLELGKTYEIYELDDRGEPVQDGALATCNGRTFTVTYEGGNSVIATAENQTAETMPKVVAVNKERRFVLPETGGRGTRGMYILGAAAVILAAWFLLYKKKKTV